MRRYLRPRWLAVHVLAVLVVAVLVSLGFWQLGRLDERRARNELFAARAELPAADVGELLDVDSPEGAVDEVRFRSVTASGTYPGNTEAVRTNQDGATGRWVFSTFDLGGDEHVVVLRGFEAGGGSEASPSPPADDVEVDVRGVAIPVARLPNIAENAVGRLAETAPDLLPVVVQAADAEPPLIPVPLPDLDDEGPHFAYAVQWFVFATIAAVGYVILLRRRGDD